MEYSADNVESWLLLKSVKGIGNKLLFKAFRHFGSVDAIFDADKPSLESVLGSKAINIIFKNFETEKVKKSMEIVKSLKLIPITYESDYYPRNLFALPDPPPVIFVKGNLELLNKESISIVGSRKALAVSLNMTKSIINNIDNKVIISGGADGIDSKAHKSALEKGLYTISVLGFGFLYANNKLFDEILNNSGALVSEFLPFEKPSKFTFPIRNRIISALGNDILIMQASAKSGALISAYWSYKLKRRVFAFVSNPVEEFEGCINLVRDGIAKIFTNINHIMADLDIKQEQTPQNPILKHLEKPLTFEELLLKTNYDEEKLTLELTMLEIEGLLRKEGAYFIKNA